MEVQNPASEAPPVTPPAPAAPPPPASATPPPPEPKAPEADVVKVSLSEWQKREARLAEFDRQLAEAEQKAREANERALQRQIENGEVTKALESIKQTRDSDVSRVRAEAQAELARTRAEIQAEKERIAAEKAAAENARNAIYQRAQRYALDGELGRTLSAHNLVPGGAEQLATLWRSNFTVNEEGESFAVRAGTGQSVGEFVAAQLARPEYAHFLRAGSAHGGTQHPGANPSAAAPASAPQAEQPPPPRNMGEAVILHMQQMQAKQGDAAMDMSLPMGLKAAR